MKIFKTFLILTILMITTLCYSMPNAAVTIDTATGNVVNTNLSVNFSNTVRASNFVGEGSLLTNVNPSWTTNTLDPTGWANNDNIGVYYFTNNGSTVTCGWSTTPAKLYINGVGTNISNVYVTVATNIGQWFVYYRNPDFALVTTQAAWNFYDAQLMTFYVNGTNDPIIIRETHGFMPWSVHRRFHSDPTLATAYSSGYAFATNGIRSVIFASGQIFDEDILNTSGTQTNLQLSRRLLGTNLMIYNPRAVTPFLTNSSTQNLQFDSNSVLVDVSTANGGWYANTWFYAIPNSDTNYSIVGVIGQLSSNSLALTQSENPPSLLPGFFSQEAVLIARATYRNSPTIAFSGWTDYRQSKISGATTVFSGATGTGNPANISVVNGAVTSITDASSTTNTWTGVQYFNNYLAASNSSFYGPTNFCTDADAYHYFDDTTDMWVLTNKETSTSMTWSNGTLRTINLGTTGSSTFGGTVIASNGVQDIPYTLTYTNTTNVIFDCSQASTFLLPVTNTTFVILTNVVTHKNYRLITKESATGGYPITWLTNAAVSHFKWSYGVVPVNTTNANAEDFWSFSSGYTGTNLFGTCMANFNP